MNKPTSPQTPATAAPPTSQVKDPAKESPIAGKDSTTTNPAAEAAKPATK